MFDKIKSYPFKLILTSLGLWTAALPAHALCNGSYEWAIQNNKNIVSQYGACVYDEDWFIKKHSFTYKSARDSWLPGIGIVYDILTTRKDNFKRDQIAELQAVNESIRTYGIALWQDQILVNNILRDSLLFATENKSFQKLYQEIHQVKPTLTQNQVASFINAANYEEHFCLEEPEPMFIKNEFGRQYPTALRALFSFEDMKNALLNGEWSDFVGTTPTVIQAPSTLSYPTYPVYRPGHFGPQP